MTLPARRYAKIGVENCAYSFDELFTYVIPDALRKAIMPGVRVLVPFGRGNRERQGFVFAVEETPDTVTDDRAIKSVSSVLDSEPLLNGEMLLLALQMRERTFSTYFSCAKAMLPGGMCLLEKAVGEASVQMLSLGISETAASTLQLTTKQNAVVRFLSEVGSASFREISYYTGTGETVARNLVKKGICVVSDVVYDRRPENFYSTEPSREIVLSDQQSAALNVLLDAYRSRSSETVLLHGVTGSGKTSVYLRLIDFVLEEQKNVIVLVPEISLTPQTISLFSARYGDHIAVMHSGLSMGERRDEFYRIKNGEARVVIGTRSAVFAPLGNIGAIIVDEEQEHTYKSEMSPRYDARNVARLRCKSHGALLVLASATPSVETYARAQAGKYKLCTLSERYGGAVLPQVMTVDMTDRQNVSAFSAVSVPLEEELQKNLNAGEQSILLVNRRGYNTFVVCKACKNVVSCPKCSISMTYHAANHRLMCHYCGYSIPYVEKCPVCAEENICYTGFGTQRVEQDLIHRFPSARILRMDADTTAAKNAHAKALGAFANGDYDILIGTQMVAKGLDFPRVTLVGIVSADNELYGGDFRGNEKTFDLLTQVIGRAGRGEKKGRAVIQTVSPDNLILTLAARQDYEAFYQNEIALRRAMVYPPFCDLCLIWFSGENKGQVKMCADAFFEKLRQNSVNGFSEQGVIVLGPLSPRIPKVNNQYRQKLIIKCKNSPAMRELINLTLKEIYADRAFSAVSVYAVVNPDRTD